MNLIKNIKKLRKKKEKEKNNRNIPEHYTEQRNRILQAEKLLSNGLNCKANQSILFFTTHKCASTFVSTLLELVNKKTPYSHYDYDGEIYGLGNKMNVSSADGLSGTGEPSEFLNDAGQYLFRTTGEIYGPLRFPIFLEDQKRYRAIFFLRDPRDVAVSAYYSFGFSHGMPENLQREKIFRDERNRIVQEGIDRYSIRIAKDWLKPLYKSYHEMRSSFEDTVFLSYVEFVDRPAEFFDKLAEFMKLGPVDGYDDIQDLIVKTKKINSDAQNADKLHQRSGRNDQYISELKPETVDAVNDILREELKIWGFSTQ